jgi:hypothetical protein
MGIEPRTPPGNHRQRREPSDPKTAAGDRGPARSRLERSRRGRPRLTDEELRARIAAYGKRHGVGLNELGLPPFPAGQRETEQHREWMALYKANRRLSERQPSTADLERRQELLTQQQGRCPVCRKALEVDESRLDDGDAIDGNPHDAGAAVLHTPCRQLVDLARSLGSDAVDRAKARL